MALRLITGSLKKIGLFIVGFGLLIALGEYLQISSLFKTPPPGLVGNCTINSIFHALSPAIVAHQNQIKKLVSSGSVSEESIVASYMHDLNRYQSCKQKDYQLSEFNIWFQKTFPGVLFFQRNEALKAAAAAWNEHMPLDLQMLFIELLPAPQTYSTFEPSEAEPFVKVILQKDSSLTSDLAAHLEDQAILPNLTSEQDAPAILVIEAVYARLFFYARTHNEYNKESNARVFDARQNQSPYVIPSLINLSNLAPHIQSTSSIAYELVGIINQSWGACGNPRWKDPLNGQTHLESFARDKDGTWVHLDDTFTEPIQHTNPIKYITEEHYGISSTFVYVRI